MHYNVVKNTSQLIIDLNIMQMKLTLSHVLPAH